MAIPFLPDSPNDLVADEVSDRVFVGTQQGVSVYDYAGIASSPRAMVDHQAITSPSTPPAIGSYSISSTP